MQFGAVSEMTKLEGEKDHKIEAVIMPYEYKVPTRIEALLGALRESSKEGRIRDARGARYFVDQQGILSIFCLTGRQPIRITASRPNDLMDRLVAASVAPTVEGQKVPWDRVNRILGSALVGNVMLETNLRRFHNALGGEGGGLLEVVLGEYVRLLTSMRGVGKIVKRSRKLVVKSKDEELPLRKPSSAVVEATPQDKGSESATDQLKRRLAESLDIDPMPDKNLQVIKSKRLDRGLEEVARVLYMTGELVSLEEVMRRVYLGESLPNRGHYKDMWVRWAAGRGNKGGLSSHGIDVIIVSTGNENYFITLRGAVKAYCNKVGVSVPRQTAVSKARLEKFKAESGGKLAK